MPYARRCWEVDPSEGHDLSCDTTNAKRQYLVAMPMFDNLFASIL